MTVRHIAHSPRLDPAPRGLLDLVLHTILKTWRAAEDLYARHQHRRGVIEMLELDDHMLRDMGVTRADVLRATRLPLSESAGDELVRASRRNRSLH